MDQQRSVSTNTATEADAPTEATASVTISTDETDDTAVPGEATVQDTAAVRQQLPIGTRSLLYGVHTWWIHPFMVAWGWYRCYGLARYPLFDDNETIHTSLFDWRLWVTFFVHDIGYWGCRDMDDAEGERHPERGMRIMTKLAGARWGEFSGGHSRFYAELLGIPTSALMRPDKLASALVPGWLYALQCWLTGEWEGYLKLDKRYGYKGTENAWDWARLKQEEWRKRYDYQGRTRESAVEREVVIGKRESHGDDCTGGWFEVVGGYGNVSATCFRYCARSC